MRVGLLINLMDIQHKPVGDYLAGIAQQAEQAGFSTITVPDHFSLKPESLMWMLKIDEVIINYPHDAEGFDRLANSLVPLIETFAPTKP